MVVAVKFFDSAMVIFGEFGITRAVGHALPVLLVQAAICHPSGLGAETKTLIYSNRIASAGSSLLAFFAGTYPDATPNRPAKATPLTKLRMNTE
jgi:hypothetical protein